jgi:N-acetylmuramoyl-L-alanine amidase
MTTAIGGCTKKNSGDGSDAKTVSESSQSRDVSVGSGLSIETPEEEANMTENDEQAEEAGVLEGKTVVIDPGHQSHANSSQEPIGPGASETKAKVTGGTSGCVTGLPEYKLTLQVSLKLGAALEEEGCTVIYTRTENDVDLSNSERAAIANEAEADAFVRIHADGSTDSSVNGAMTICQTASNPYNGELHDASYELAENILDALVEETGARREKIWETDTMSGINWCTVPATIVEMGYMTNPDEDRKLSDESYQEKIVTGIVNGIIKTIADD